MSSNGTGHWNYRVLDYGEGNWDRFRIHEVYYDDQGKITAWTELAMEPAGDTVEDLQGDLRRMLDDTDRPVLVKAELEARLPGNPEMDHRAVEEVDRLRKQLEEARLWARAYKTLETDRLWRAGTWGLNLDGMFPGTQDPPTWLLEPLPADPSTPAEGQQVDESEPKI